MRITLRSAHCTYMWCYIPLGIQINTRLFTAAYKTSTVCYIKKYDQRMLSVIPARVIDGDSGTRAAFLSTSVRLRLQSKGINRSNMSRTANAGAY